MADKVNEVLLARLAELFDIGPDDRVTVAAVCEVLGVANPRDEPDADKREAANFAYLAAWNPYRAALESELGISLDAAGGYSFRRLAEDEKAPSAEKGFRKALNKAAGKASRRINSIDRSKLSNMDASRTVESATRMQRVTDLLSGMMKRKSWTTFDDAEDGGKGDAK